MFSQKNVENDENVQVEVVSLLFPPAKGIGQMLYRDDSSQEKYEEGFSDALNCDRDASTRLFLRRFDEGFYAVDDLAYLFGYITGLGTLENTSITEDDTLGNGYENFKVFPDLNHIQFPEIAG